MSANDKIQEMIDWFNTHENATWDDYYAEIEQKKQKELEKGLEQFALFAKEEHTLQEWKEKFLKFNLKYCNSSENDLISYQTYQMFVDGNVINKEYLLPLLIDIYISYGVDNTFVKYLMKALRAEPKKVREQRLTEIRNEISENVDDHDMVTLYRGHFRRVDAKRRTRAENSMDFNKAVSFSTKKEKALWFANRHKIAFQNSGKQMEYKVTTIKIPLEDIAYFTNDRQEFECVIKPISKGGRVEIIEEELI